MQIMDFDSYKRSVFEHRDSSYIPALVAELRRRGEHEELRHLFAYAVFELEMPLRLTALRDGVQVPVSLRDVLDEPPTSPIRAEAPFALELEWDHACARLFAADCAEHVLHIYEAVHSDGKARGVINQTREKAFDEEHFRKPDGYGEVIEGEVLEHAVTVLSAVPPEPQDALRAWMAAHCTCHWREYMSLTIRHARVARRLHDGRQDEEEAWQRRRLLEYLLGEVELKRP